MNQIGFDLNLQSTGPSSLILGKENLQNYKFPLSDVEWSERQGRLSQYFLLTSKGKYLLTIS